MTKREHILWLGINLGCYIVAYGLLLGYKYLFS